jgi:hypothetical protein
VALIVLVILVVARPPHTCNNEDLTSYCQAVAQNYQDVAGKLDMHYQTPRLPVDMKYTKADPKPTESSSGHLMDAEYLVKGF